jgi:hypothetical protein
VIVIFEPICRDISHERVNGGFILGVRAAFPQERILFCGEAGHIACLRELFALEQVEIDGIFFKAVNIDEWDGLGSVLSNLRIVRRVFEMALKHGATRVLFTAVSPSVMVAVNRLKNGRKYRDLKCIYVMHGILESVGTKTGGFSAGKGREPREIVRASMETEKTGLLARVMAKLGSVGAWRLTLYIVSLVGTMFWKLVFGTVRKFADELYAVTVDRWVNTRLLNFKLLFERLDSSWCMVIVLAPHVFENLKRMITVGEVRIAVVTMPYLFSGDVKNAVTLNSQQKEKDRMTRFGLVGKGHPGRLRELADCLLEVQPHGRFEIAAYTMNNSGFDRYPIIRTFGAGVRVPRETIKEEAPSVDYLIYLYDETEYNLSCSASFFEVFSNVIPFLALPCECIDYFNTAKFAIGYKCRGIKEMASLMRKIIDEPENSRAEREIFCGNIRRIRAVLDITENPIALREALKWEEIILDSDSRRNQKSVAARLVRNR